MLTSDAASRLRCLAAPNFMNVLLHRASSGPRTLNSNAIPSP